MIDPGLVPLPNPTQVAGWEEVKSPPSQSDMTPPQEWRPAEMAALKQELAGFTDWVLCGGHSVALLAGSDTRAHGDTVFYRRDRRIRWAKAHHSVSIAGLRVLNPYVTFLFKANKPVLEEKEIHDLVKLIEANPKPPQYPRRDSEIF